MRSARLYSDMARSRKHSDALLEISQAVSAGEHVSLMIENILKIALDAVDAELVLIHHFNTSKKCFETVVSCDNDKIEHSSETINLGQEVEGFVAETGDFIQIDSYIHEQRDPESDIKFDTEFNLNRHYKTSSVMCAPIVDPEGNTLAVIKAVNKASSYGSEQGDAATSWSEEDSAIIQSIAESTGVALHKSLLLQDVLIEQKKNKR